MLKKFKLNLSNSRGDTIIEVIIVLAVLGLAISISYATANRSLLNARQAQENATATTLVQSQIEALRTMTGNTGAQNIFQAGSFCVSQATPYTRISNVPTPDPNCTVGLYALTIKRTNFVTKPDTFTVVATWPDILGQGTDTVTTIYRLHKP